MFLQVSVCPQGVSAPLHAGIDPHGPEADTPWQTPPGRHPQHPSLADTNPTTIPNRHPHPTPGRPPSPGRHPLGRHLPPSAWWDTHPRAEPPGQTPLPLRWPLQRTVRILLECILVYTASRCSWISSFKTLFWNVFGYGDREDPDVVVANCNLTSNVTDWWASHNLSRGLNLSDPLGKKK